MYCGPIFSGSPAAAKRSPILIWERKGNPSMNFPMVIMASGIARGRVRTTTTATTESRKMAAIPNSIWTEWSTIRIGNHSVSSSIWN